MSKRNTLTRMIGNAAAALGWQTSKRRRGLHRRRLALEPLESRQLLSVYGTMARDTSPIAEDGGTTYYTITLVGNEGETSWDDFTADVVIDVAYSYADFNLAASSGFDSFSYSSSCWNTGTITGTMSGTSACIQITSSDDADSIDGQVTLEVNSGCSSWSASCSCNPAGGSFASSPTPSATVTITDDDDGNTPPTADAGGPYSVNEGSSISLSGSGSSDSDGTVVSYQWDLDNDGFYDDATGVSATFSAANLDGPDDSPWTVGLRVTDDDGATDTDTATISIVNVASTVTLGDDATIYQGGTFTGSGSFSDPCLADMWTATVNYGDGSGNQSLSYDGDREFSLSHVYATSGDYTVTVTVTDDDGGSDSDTLEVTVLPAAEVMVISPDRYATEPDEAFQTATDTGRFVISRTGDTTCSLIVNFSLSGNAVYGANDDYTLTEGGLSVDISSGGTGYVELFPGQSSATIVVIPEYDELKEGAEFVALTLAGGTGYTIASPNADVVAIMDPNVEPIPCGDALIVSGDTCGSSGNGNHIVPFCIDGLGCFRYMSDANPHPTVAVDALIQHEFGSASLVTVEAELNLGGVTKTVYYDASSVTATDLYRLAVQVDASTLGTGRHDWTLTVTQTYSDSSVRVGAYTGSKNLVDLSDSPFGRRWGAGEYQKVMADDEGVLWLYKGNLRLFANDGSGGYEAISDPLGYWTLSGNWSAGFTVTHADGTVETFSASGVRTASTDRNGNETTYSYTSGKLTGITFPGGHQTTLVYDANGYLDYVDDYGGRRTDFTIDSNGQIQSIAMPDPDGSGGTAAPTYEFHYTSTTGMMDWMEDPADVRTAYVHDSAGLLISIEHADGTADEWSNGLSSVFSGGLQYVEDGTGTSANKAALTDYLASDLPATRTHSANPSSDSEITVDRFGQPTSIVDAGGNETMILRNEEGQIVRIVEPDPDGAGTEYESAVTKFHYDSRGNMLYTSYPDGSRETWTYDSTYNVPTSYTFTPPSGSGEPTLRSVYTIDGSGNVTRERQISNLDDSLYPSDAGGNPDIVIDYTYTDGTETGTPPKGLLKTVTYTSHPDAPVTSYEYNSHGELVKVTEADPDGAGGLTAPVTEYVWNSDGTLASMTETDVGATFSNTTDYDYDDAGRLIEVTSPDPDGAGPLPRPVVRYTYHADGTVATLTETTDATGAEMLVTSYTYTSGQLTTVTYPDPDGSGPEYSPVTEYVYTDGLLTEVYETSADPSGESQLTQYVYDAMNRLVETIYPDPDGAGPLPSPVETVYYDDAGRVLRTGEKTTDAGDAELLTDYVYDVVGRVTSVVLPDADTLGGTNRSTTSYTYYGSGQVKTVTDPLGAVTSYEYNDLGQLVLVTMADPDGTGDLNSPTIVYEYDAAGRLTSEIQSHTGSSAQELETQYTYDSLDRMVTVTLPDPDGSGTGYTSSAESYEYDLAGNLKRTVDAFGAVTEYAHDALGRLTREITSDAYTPQDGLIGHWRLDETEGTIARDSSTSGVDADLLSTGTVMPIQIAGFDGNALDFNGTTAYAKVENVSVDTTLGAQHTLAFWMRWDDDSSAVPFDLGGIHIFIGGTTLAVNTGVGDKLGVSISGFEEKWVHVAIVVTNGTPSADNTKIYLSGEEQQLVASGNAPTSRSVSSTIYIGKNASTNPTYYYHYDGALDDIRYYKGELSAEEVAALARPAALGHWRFDETEGTIARDSSTSGVDADLLSTSTVVPTQIAGFDGNALDFNGTSAYAKVEDVNVDTTLGAQHTLAFWMRWDGDTSAMPFDLGGINIYISGSTLAVNTGAGDMLGTSINGFQEQWVHVAIVVTNGTPSAQNTKIYLNGEEQQLVASGNAPASQSVGSTVYFGKSQSTNPTYYYHYDGALDDVRYYKGELSAEEVAALARPAAGGLVTHWAFDESSGATASDSSGHHIEATLLTYGTVYPTWVDDGKIDGALEFDGDDAYGEIHDVPVNTLDGAKNTVAFWMKWNGSSLELPMSFDKMNLAVWGDWIGINTYVGDFLRTPSGSITSGEWIHVAVVFNNGAITAETCKIYLNGQEQTLTQTKDGGSYVPNRSVNRHIFLGKAHWYDAYQFDGKLDDFRVYNRELSAEDVAALVGLCEVADGQTTYYDYDDFGNLESVQTPSGEMTAWAYDNLHRTTSKSVDPGGTNMTWSYTYDAFGKLATTTDAKGHTTSYSYDGLNRLVETTLHNGADTVYTYNNRGYLASVTDPTDNVTSYTYDYLGRLKTESIWVAGTRTETYWYDLAGQMTKMEDRLGQATFYDYDNLGRVYQERWKDSGGTTVRTIGYEFDDLGRLAGVSEVDGSAASVGADYSYTYDNLGRVTQTVHDLAGLTPDVMLDQTFDAAGSRTQLEATIGSTGDFVNDFSYDALGQMTTVTQQGQAGGNAVAEKLVEFDYSASGQFLEIRRYADLLENEYVARTGFSYDSAGRLTDLTQSSGGLGSAIEYSLGYDDHLLDTVTYAGKTFDFSYDTVDQLVDVDYTGTGTPADETFTYDDSGNRTDTGYPAGDHNRLHFDGTYVYHYDHNGNRTMRFVDNDSSGTQTLGDTSITEYEWDHRNRLTRVTERAAFAGAATQVVEYEYDAFNRLIRKELDADGDGAGTSTETFWIYDGDQAVLEFDGGTAADLSHRYLWGPVVDQLLADETADDGGSEDVLWPLTDWQGSVRHLATYDASTDVTTIANEKVHDAYGNVASETNSAVDTVFGYTGRMWDDDTGLQNNLNRWYDPRVGRWLSEDPIGFAAGDVNLYRYVGNSPGMGVDASGLAHLPGNARGEWVEGVRGDGVFQYADTPDNRERGLVGKRVRYKNQHIAPSGLPPEWYYRGNAEAATVPISKVLGTDADFTAADAAMRSKLRDPNWQRPSGYTWNHAGEPGSTKMELVKTKYHKAIAHQGSARCQRSLLRRTGRMLGRGAANALIIGDVYMTVRDAAQAAGLVQPDYVVGSEFDYHFTCDDGSIFGVEVPGRMMVFARPKIRFLAGPREGQTIPITDEDADLLRKEAEARWGRYVPGTVFRGPRFVPGTERKSISVTDSAGRYLGYIDENGYHENQSLRDIRERGGDYF